MVIYTSWQSTIPNTANPNERCTCDGTRWMNRPNTATDCRPIRTRKFSVWLIPVSRRPDTLLPCRKYCWFRRFSSVDSARVHCHGDRCRQISYHHRSVLVIWSLRLLMRRPLFPPNSHATMLFAASVECWCIQHVECYYLRTSQTGRIEWYGKHRWRYCLLNMLTRIMIVPIEYEAIGGQIEAFHVVGQVHIVPLLPSGHLTAFTWLLLVQYGAHHTRNIVEHLQQIQREIYEKFIFQRWTNGCQWSGHFMTGNLTKHTRYTTRNTPSRLITSDEQLLFRVAMTTYRKIY